MNNEDSNPEIIDIKADDVIEQEASENRFSPPSKPHLNRKLMAGAGAATILLSAIGGGWFYRDMLSNYLPSDQVQAMVARIDTLEANAKSFNTKLDAVVGVTDEIKSQLGAAQAAAENADKIANGLKSDSGAMKLNIVTLQTALAKANTSLEELRGKLGNGVATPSQPDSSALVARVDNLEKDYASLKQASTNQITDNSVLSQSLADLKAKIAAGVSFKDELPRIQRLVPAADGLDVLGTYAEAGLPNAQGLAQELKNLAPALPELSAPQAAADESWWGSAGSIFSQLITVKAAGAPDWRLLAEQSAELAQQGDLAKSVSSLESSEVALPVELQQWHDRAAARIALEAALVKTSNAVLRQIAAKG